MKDAGRQDAPFVVRVESEAGEGEILARAVIDASGTIDKPGMLGASGLPARGERTAADGIYSGFPDVRGAARDRYAGGASSSWVAATRPSMRCSTSRHSHTTFQTRT